MSGGGGGEDNGPALLHATSGQHWAQRHPSGSGTPLGLPPQKPLLHRCPGQRSQRLPGRHRRPRPGTPAHAISMPRPRHKAARPNIRSGRSCPSTHRHVLTASSRLSATNRVRESGPHLQRRSTGARLPAIPGGPNGSFTSSPPVPACPGGGSRLQPRRRYTPPLARVGPSFTTMATAHHEAQPAAVRPVPATKLAHLADPLLHKCSTPNRQKVGHPRSPILSDQWWVNAPALQSLTSWRPSCRMARPCPPAC
ncbi:hypothetical protein NDU88_004639 [Pleurodeles waltl]|uniref:Uncharacterized protein n=1 Tax=Pleurodeles waltl TaxID=8319 RepID=A0AAV7UHL5_PLEWA|nr:hypothetical protein NDU88_004639 [Pleurodeles waltl]